MVLVAPLSGFTPRREEGLLMRGKEKKPQHSLKGTNTYIKEPEI